jgi:hypothetical protein
MNRGMGTQQLFVVNQANNELLALPSTNSRSQDRESLRKAYIGEFLN